MAINDKFLNFSSAQEINATAFSTDIIDLAAPGTRLRDIGPGTPLRIAFSISESFNTLTSLAIEVYVDTDSTQGSGGTASLLASFGPILLASLTAGTQFQWTLPQLPFSTSDVLGVRYMYLRYLVAGSNPTTGIVTASLVATAPDTRHAYASGFTVT